MVSRASEVRHDTITVPVGASPAEVQELAQRQAQAQVGADEAISFLHVHGSRPVTGSSRPELEWRFSYHVTPAGKTGPRHE